MPNHQERVYIQEWREALEMKQDDIARIVGRTTSNISKLEAKTTDIKLEYLLLIANAMNIPWKLLLNKPPTNFNSFFKKLNEDEKHEFKQLISDLMRLL